MKPSQITVCPNTGIECEECSDFKPRPRCHYGNKYSSKYIASGMEGKMVLYQIQKM